MDLSQCTAVLFDLDGVLTDTASAHERAWRRTFTAVFEASASTRYTIADYFTHIDGKPRVEGVRAVLASRGIRVPEGRPDDDPGLNTVHGLGNRKNALFMAELDERGPRTFAGANELLDWLDSHAIPKGVVSSSRNAEPVLRAGGLRHKVDVVVDGVVAAELGLTGKPDPATYLYAAAALGSPPATTIVVEDATSGVEAGRRGGFRVIGLDRGAGREDLIRHGADVVVDDLDSIFTRRY